MKVIENWWTEPGGNGCTAPEVAGLVICGDCGDRGIRTSRVKSVEGKIVKTLNSTYQLGTIRKEFLDHLKECGYPFDPENPIKIVDKLTVLEKKSN